MRNFQETSEKLKGRDMESAGANKEEATQVQKMPQSHSFSNKILPLFRISFSLPLNWCFWSQMLEKMEKQIQQLQREHQRFEEDRTVSLKKQAELEARLTSQKNHIEVRIDQYFQAVSSSILNKSENFNFFSEWSGVSRTSNPQNETFKMILFPSFFGQFKWDLSLNVLVEWNFRFRHKNRRTKRTMEWIRTKWSRKKTRYRYVHATEITVTFCSNVCF